MKTNIMTVAACVLAISLVSCDAQYKKTSSGLVYKIIKGGSKDSAARADNVMKFNVVVKINDSVLYDSHDKMPQYITVSDKIDNSYSFMEVLPLLKKGDSAIVIQLVDTLFKQGYQAQLPYAKKGDRLNTYMKVLEVFRTDSIARADAKIEYEKDTPRREKEEKEMMAKQQEEMKQRLAEAKKQRAIEIEQLRKSGEVEKEEKEILAYLAAKKITNYKKVGGTYVVIKDKGTGAPAVNGKFVTVKYAGRVLTTDSLFQANQYIFQPGEAEVIQGWDEGIPEFNEGGKGTLYVPGYLAYGKSEGPPANKAYAALIFEVEILNVSDTREAANRDKFVADSIVAARMQAPKKVK
jgi:FKBP-type peptidyl-prolyl cis-trans isomerase FkpA